MTIVGAHAHPDDWLERSCAAVAVAVRSHSALLEQVIYRQVSRRVPEVMLAGDITRQAQAQATIAAIVGYCLDAIEQGPASLAGRTPQAALERARAAGREGERIGPLLRALEAGYQIFVAFIIAETKEMPNAALVREHLSKTYGGLVGDIAAALECEYERERVSRKSPPKHALAMNDSKLALALTRREREVLDLLLKERSYKEIAQELHLTRNTVHTHASHVYRKLGVKGRRGLGTRQR